MKIITLSPQEFDKFASTHRYRNYYQTSAYGNTMASNGFKIHYLGITDNLNHLIGATLIIYKEIFMNQKIAYAPRGILFDYSNSVSVQELVNKLKQVLGKQGFLLLRMDPYIPATIRNKRGLVKNMNNGINIIMSNLKHAGFKYKGQNQFFENEKGRYEAVTLLADRDIKSIYRSFSKNTRHKINKASASGIMIVNDKNKNIDFLYNFIKEKANKSKKYYEDLVKNFNIKANVYYAVLDTNTFVISSKKVYEHELEKNEYLSKKIQEHGIATKKPVKKNILNSKMESDRLLNVYKNQLVLATKLLQDYPNNLILGGALTIEYDNAIYLIVDGYDKKYKNLCCNYLIRWYIINEGVKKQYKYFNMSCISGEFRKKNPYSGLNENKIGFDGIPTEYIGEFDLILNNFNYKLYQSFSKEKNYKLKNMNN
ncbi:MAG: peptidoglycan bridge formation glycyltransferase FemA/FemB family protein [Clostridium sp.]|jgi:fmhA protein / lysostaphin immunity factor|nr:peptidoglycan bridge formation glycyltransferase FemA/FemB family protein [Clostridium sp.]